MLGRKGVVMSRYPLGPGQLHPCPDEGLVGIFEFTSRGLGFEWTLFLSGFKLSLERRFSSRRDYRGRGAGLFHDRDRRLRYPGLVRIGGFGIVVPGRRGVKLL